MMIFRKRLLCVTVCLCMIFGMMPATAQAATGEDTRVSGETVKAYKIGDTSFNIKGVDKNRKYWTTFLDRGYDTAVSVDGGKKRIKPGKLIASGLSLDVTLDKEGDNYVKVQYTLTNTGSKAHTVKVGSYADVMIDNNDRAPIHATEAGGNTLLMTGSPSNDYAFKLVAPTCNTLWYGYYGKCVKKCFTNMESRGPSNIYRKDSGISYSWNATVEPGKTWSRYVLIGTGSAEQMNVGTPTIPQPEEIVPDPEITLTTNELYFTEGESLPADWKNYIASSEGDVTVTGNPANTNTPGTYTVTYTAKNDKGTADASLKVHILQKPAELSQTTSKTSGANSFALTATMLYTGGVNWTETGFVYGVISNPTLSKNDGKVTTGSTVKVKGGTLNASVAKSSLTEGLQYYARAYAKASDGSVIYGMSSSAFGVGVPSYGTFSVSNNGNNTFTIKRTGGSDGAQTVYYRTVNGSAVGGTHFEHTWGSLDFNAGEISKTVTVAENSVTALYKDKAATAYSNADRVYFMELARVTGGASIGTSRATRTMKHDSKYTVSKTVYNEKSRNVSISDSNKWVADHSGKGDWKIYFQNDRNKNTNRLNFNVSRPFDVNASALEKAYLKETAAGFLYKSNFTYKEDDEGYQLAWMGNHTPNGYGPSTISSKTAIPLDDSEFGNAYFTATWETDSGDAALNLPAMSGTKISKVNGTKAESDKKVGDYILFGMDETAHVWFSSAGANKDIWYMNSYTDYVKARDAVEPQLIGTKSNGYEPIPLLPGEKVTISLIFDEIVDEANSKAAGLSSNSYITVSENQSPFLSWGNFYYEGGAGTNVLYFTGTVPEGSTRTYTQLEVNLNSCKNQIKDMCNDTGTSTGNGAWVDSVAYVKQGLADAATVSVGDITNTNGTLSGTIIANNAVKLEYAWSTSSTIPTYGWTTSSSPSKTSVTTSRSAGTYYLHARATNSDGVTTTAYKSVTVPASGTGAPVNADLTVSVDNSSWAKTRNITVTRSSSDATVTVKTPAGTTETVTSSSYTATANGVYNFTLTYNKDETVTRQAVVSKLDNTAPAITINDLKNTAHADQVTLMFSVTDGGSGVKTVTAKWNDRDADLTNNGDGTYTTTCPSATGDWKLTVTAVDNVGNSSNKESKTYTVNLNKPVLKVTESSTTNQGVSYSYSVDDKGNEDVIVYLPDGTQTDKLTGSFTLTEAGSYIIAVTDKAGHFVSKELVVTASVDGVAPEVRLYADDSAASDELPVDVLVYEESGMPAVKQGSADLTVTKDNEEEGNYTGSFTVTDGGVYTVTAADAAGNTGNGSITVYALVNGTDTTLKLPAADSTYGTLPTPAARTGYTFDGWYTAETEGTRANSGMKVETAYTLYARWTPVTYNVTLVGDRDSGTNLTSYTYGEGAALPDDWTKQCATFAGWYTAETGGSKIEKIGADEHGDRTYYARWTSSHTWKDATCTAPKTCSVCNITEGEALGHNYETTWSKDAEKHWKICTVCKLVVEPEAVHIFGKWITDTPATEDKEGTKHRVCETCGYSQKTAIPKLEHTHNLTKVTGTPATCTEGGTKDYWKCDGCDKMFEDEQGTTIITDINIPVKGHCKGEAKKENEVAATCTSDGSYDEVIYCTVCKAEISRDKKSTPAAGHSFELEKAEEEYLKSEATCAAPAVYYKSCKCGEKGTETFEYGAVNPDRHTGGAEIRNASEANHVLQTKGYTGDTYCTGCNKMLGTGTEILPGDHIPDSVWKMNENRHWKECSISGCSAVIASTGEAHIYDGDEDADCNICGYTRKIIPIHKHDLKTVAATAATCTSTGNIEYYRCEDCGKLFSDPAGTKEITAESVVTGKLPHSPKELPAVEATCENTGLSAGSKCEICGTIITEQTVTAAKGHDFASGMWKHDTEQHWKKCSHCDMTDTKADHVYDNDQDASCNVCGYSRDIIPAHIHDWAVSWSHDSAYHWHECLSSGCDVTENMHKAGYAAHIEAAAVRENEIAAACTSDGSYDEVIYCTDCHAEISRIKNITEASGHDWGNWVVTKPATSSEDGEQQRVCRRDSSHVETKTLPALTHKHQYSEVVKVEYIKSAATCTEPAVYYKSCECGEKGTDTFTSGNALGHDFTVIQHNESQHWYKCSRCEMTDTKADHIYDNDQDASCNVCGYSRDIAPAHTHNWDTEWSYDSTYHWHECLNSGCDVTDNSSKDGYVTHVPGPAATETQPQICTECRYIIQAALGHTHNLTKVTGTPATCTEGGVKDYWKCSDCGKLFENEQGTAEITDTGIPAKGHSYSSVWSSDTACHWHQCIACIAETDKAAHIWGTGVITTPPTTTEEGIKTYTCEVCGTAKTESIPKRHSGGGVTPPKNDTITVDVTGDKTSVKITAEISGDTASIAEIGRNDIDKAGAGIDITIDLTVLPNEIAEVTVTKNSLENIYDSETDNVSIKLTETTVNMDRATLKNIIEQMNGSELKLVVDKHQDALESMNKAQKDTLKGMKNPKLIDAYFISGGIRITDFKGGSVEIKVPYSDKKRVRAWYIDDNGKKEKVPVKYDGKTAVLTISHFSHYVIEEDSSNNVKPAHVKKTSDKVIYVRSIKYSKKTGTKITFNKVSGADGYYVYGNRCNTDKVYKFKKLATLKGNDNTVFVHKKTAKNTFYKYYIRAYKVVDGRRVTVSRSEEIHFVTDVKGYKYGNPTKVALSSKKCTLNKGKTFSLKNRVKVYSSKKVLLHTDKVRYVSSDSRVAKVNSRGRITAEKAGSCNIYAIAQNGRAAKITVTVK